MRSSQSRGADGDSRIDGSGRQVAPREREACSRIQNGSFIEASGSVIYDEENRPTTISDSATGTQTNLYDGSGKRVQTSIGGATTAYVYDGSAIIEDIKATGNVYHLPGVMDTISGVGGSFTDTYFYNNALGSTLRTTSDAANVTTSQTEYDSYGLTYAEGTGGQTRYQWVGKQGYQTDASGLVLCGARYYVPGIGRFLTQDPSGQSAGLNLYEYCDDNPLSKSDPTGLDPLLAAAAITSWYCNPTLHGYADERACAIMTTYYFAKMSCEGDRLEHGGYIYKDPDAGYVFGTPQGGGIHGLHGLGEVDTAVYGEPQSQRGCMVAYTWL